MNVAISVQLPRVSSEMNNWIWKKKPSNVSINFAYNCIIDTCFVVELLLWSRIQETLNFYVSFSENPNQIISRDILVRNHELH